MIKKEFIAKYLQLCEESGYYISNYGFEVGEAMLGVFSDSLYPTLEQHKQELECDLELMHNAKQDNTKL